MTMLGGQLSPVYVPTNSFATTAQEIYHSLRERGAVHLCPAPPKGYVWQGPALYEDVAAPSCECSWQDGVFRFTEPQICSAEPRLGARQTLSDAQRLAARILRAPALV